MKKIIVPAALLMALIVTETDAQIPPAVLAPPAKEKSENIIIRKNGNKKEKLTIVVDGDNITVNGKPAKDFKDSDIEIIHDNDDAIDIFPPMPPMPPMPVHGGAKTFTRNFTIHSNSAVLGLMPEDGDDGARITEVTKGSAADKAGLKEDDVITKIGDTKIDDAGDVYDAIGKYKPNDKVTITYKRDKKENTVTATLDKNTARTLYNNSEDMFNAAPFVNGKSFNFSWNSKPRLGLRIQDTENSGGVTVTDIDDEDAPAAKAGLREKDIITEVNGKNVQSVKDVKDQLKDMKPGDDIKLQYKRGAASQSATIHIPKPLQTSDL